MNKEYLRFTLFFILTLTTGIVTNVYQVISHKIPLYTIVFSVIGVIIFIVTLIILKVLIDNIEKNLRELKNG